MLKLSLLVSAAILFAVAPAFVSGRTNQEAAPAQAPAPAAQAPAPAPAAAPVKGPVAPDAPNPVTPTAASQADAKAVFNRDCALCHGDNGNGKTEVATSMKMTMADWTDPKSLAGKPDGELFDIIRVGEGQMPPEDAGRAKDNQVWNIIYYIRGLSKTQAGTPRTVSEPTATPSDQ